MSKNSNSIWTYFKEQLGENPSDASLKELSITSPCGVDCAKVIKAAAAMMEVSDPVTHGDIREAASYAVSVYWRG